ncbi:hypothetical protein [Streptomyces sp. NPDC001594]|uniref:hypothetical protein n=1 Tax=Streptomyces sp. NPDC001594 TaxID=3364590 RepID=UPI0036AE36EB
MTPIEDTDVAAAPPPAPPVRYRVAAPGPVTGGVMGVAFANGHAVVDDDAQNARALAWFRAEPGYQVQVMGQPEPAEADEPEGTPAPALPEPGPPADEPPDDSSAPPARRRK